MENLHEVEELLAAPGRARLEIAERALMATHKNLFFIIIEALEASIGLCKPINGCTGFSVVRTPTEFAS